MEDPIIPIPTSRRVRPSSGLSSGLSTPNGLVSCGWSGDRPGNHASTTNPPAMPRAAHHATGRQRRERR